MNSLKQLWHRVPHGVRKPLVFIVGSVIVLAGIAMLVLPGPGWAAIFVGFAVLATEFKTAEKIRDWLVHLLKRLLHIGQTAVKTLWQQIKASWREPWIRR